MIRQRIARWTQPMTLIGGIGITMVSVWLLGVLNTRAIVPQPAHDPIRRVVILSPDSASSDGEQQPEEPEIEAADPKPMQVTLDVPLPEPVQLQSESFEMDLSLPSPTVVPVQITIDRPSLRPLAQPSVPPQPQTLTAPKNTARPSTPASVHSASQVDHPPRESSANSRPEYPIDKLQNGDEGVVVMRLLIDETGQVEDVRVVSGDKAFVDAVMAVVFKWRFSPAQHEGDAVKVWGLKKLRFSIRKG